MEAEVFQLPSCSVLRRGLTFDETIPNVLSRPSWTWKWKRSAKPPRLEPLGNDITNDAAIVVFGSASDDSHHALLGREPHSPRDKEVDGILRILPRSTPRVSSTSSDQSFQQICTWLETCQETHQECSGSNNDDGFVPFRLLDLNSNGDASQIRLVEFPRNQAKESIKYVCLSHRWGDIEPPCMTTTATLASNMVEVQWSDIPKTFSEAIDIVRRLKIRFLWLDSMCIVQDDMRDWETQAAEMADIFSNAVITLAATTALDHSYGLYSNLDPRYESHELRMRALQQMPVRIFAHRLLPDWTNKSFARSERLPPLLQRAWVYQERLLSRRTLHFDANELIWECMRGGTCQCCGSEIKRTARFSQSNSIDGSSPSSPEDPILGWWNIIQAFSRLAITFPRDRLPAISGVAKRVWQSRCGDLYAAGLWQSELPIGLHWVVASSTLAPRPNTWIAPSWSWACTNRGVDFAWAGAIPTMKYAIVSNVECIPEGEDMMGRLVYGSLDITAPVTEVFLEYELDDGRATTDRATYSITYDDSIIGNFWPDYPLGDEGDGKLDPKEPLLCMFLFLALGGEYGYCLILKKGPTSRDPCERIGLLTYQTSKGDLKSLTDPRSLELSCTIV